MFKRKVNASNTVRLSESRKQKGSAMAISLFVLALVGIFVALAVTRSASEAVAVGNETGEGRTTYAAQGSLEMMTRNFNKLFEVKLNPTSLDIADVKNAPVPGLSGPGGMFTFNQEVDQTSPSSPVVLSGGPFSGLYALRDYWRLRTTATDQSGIQVQLTRNILNNRIPIFQFGVFYEDDLELFNGPTFGFGGRVHSNRHFFIHPSANGAYFDSRVTAAGHVVTQSKRNGDIVNITTAQTWIKNASGVYMQLQPDQGSVLNGTPNVFALAPFIDAELPSSRLNTNWNTQSAIFDGNLKSSVPRLNLPLKIGRNTDLIEMIRRGKEQPANGNGGDLFDNAGTLEPVGVASADNLIMRVERFANKTGIRVSLADSKAKLPGCALGVGTAPVGTPCGVRLDGEAVGSGASPDIINVILNLRSRGYQPLPMTDGYQSTRVNGERLYTGGAQEVWIKIETVKTDPATDVLVTKDITSDILSLGVTVQAPAGMNIAGYNHTAPSTATITNAAAQAPSTGTDSRAIVKIQRFAISGASIPGALSPSILLTHSGTFGNYVRRYLSVDDTKIALGCDTCVVDDLDPNYPVASPISGYERYGHLKRSGLTDAVVPFPIKMFDSREGLYYDERSTTYYSNANFDNFRRVPRNGVMSMIEIDVANMRRFLRGDFDSRFPTTTPFAVAKGSALTSADIPNNSGWVLYVSDRRGDADFDGEFDMEDIYGASPGNDGTMQPGEDLDLANTYGSGVLETAYGTETERYANLAVYTDAAAINDHKYYRRGVRLVNGSTLPGIFDSAVSNNTRGFTVSSENAVYVQGNYNATGIGTVPASGNSAYDQYLPFNTSTHIPASVVSDAVIILSNAWDDSKSFVNPYDQGARNASTTQMRFAMLAGDTITSITATPHQGGGDMRLNGGLHNFKRFLEDWGGQRLDYTGSLINLYNSRNNNGAFKCCNTVYSPPRRNWVFDSTFLDPTRIPPGTPYFQYVQTTGFQRTNS